MPLDGHSTPFIELEDGYLYSRHAAQESDQQSWPPNITHVRLKTWTHWGLTEEVMAICFRFFWVLLAGYVIARERERGGWAAEGYYRYRITFQKGQTSFSWMVWPVVAHLRTSSRARHHVFTKALRPVCSLRHLHYSRTELSNRLGILQVWIALSLRWNGFQSTAGQRDGWLQ
jgi:hypothetical protein